MREKKVIMIAAMTLCGRISPAPLGSAVDRRFLEAVRDKTDASLMGGNTLRHGDPEMRGSVCGRHRLRALITMSGDIPVAGKKIFAQGPKPLVFCGDGVHAGLGERLRGRAELIALPLLDGFLSIAAAIRELEKRGAGSILVEGGAILNYRALRERVVDEILVTITPQLFGGEGAPSLVEGVGSLGCPFLALELLSCRQEKNGELFTHYRVKYEE
ncbi:MAG: hypothetical protein BM485_15230 [Desulfobulbaceae bacterium DB1]|nr:MAG: hypothetical protein BM485_15230 [Desulfobulbaceae bacterium DB1]